MELPKDPKAAAFFFDYYLINIPATDIAFKESRLKPILRISPSEKCEDLAELAIFLSAYKDWNIFALVAIENSHASHRQTLSRTLGFDLISNDLLINRFMSKSRDYLLQPEEINLKNAGDYVVKVSLTANEGSERFPIIKNYIQTRFTYNPPNKAQ